jgi:hypothetical protein
MLLFVFGFYTSGLDEQNIPMTLKKTYKLQRNPLSMEIYKNNSNTSKFSS